MLFADGFAGLLFLGLWIFCFIDVIMTPDGTCRNLPKLAWIFIVLLLVDIGSIAWLVAGRPWNKVAVQSRGAGGKFPESDRSKRHVATNPDDDEEFLAGLRQRAEEQRRRARESQQPREGETPDGV